MLEDLPAEGLRTAHIAGPNDVITTNNLILQASRALTGEQIDISSLFDLAALIEAVVLHDHLLFLESPSQFDFRSLPLGNLLITEDIVKSYVPAVTVQEIQESVFRLFGIPNAYDKVAVSPFSARLNAASVLPYYGDYDFFSPNQVTTLLTELEIASKLPPFGKSIMADDNPSSTLPHFCFNLVEMWSENNVWARRPAQAFLVRTLVYWAVSDRLNISFRPDLSRIPLVTHITHQLQTSLGRGTYPAVAKAFYVSEEELEWTRSPCMRAIPPLTVLVLEGANTIDEVGYRLLELRKEFSLLRDRLREYESQIRQASSLRDLRQARDGLTDATRQIAEAFPIQDQLRILETTSYYRRAAQGSDPLSQAYSYSSEFLFKPVEWIREWWVRRNAIHIFDMKNKLDHLEVYTRLVRLITGKEVERNDEDLFRKYAEYLDTMYF